MRDKTQKPAKPYPDFPLFPHARGKWAAKIGGKLYYFWRWEDPFEALQHYKNRVEGIKAGWDPRKLPGVLEAKTACTIMVLCNHFQNAKRVHKESGQLAAKTFSQYFHACDLSVKHFGKDTLVTFWDRQTSPDCDRPSLTPGGWGVMEVVNRTLPEFSVVPDTRIWWKRIE